MTLRFQVFLQKLARALRRFGRARNGNVALTFALAVVPIIAMVGAAVDFSRANSMKANNGYYEHVWRAAGTAAAPATSTWNGCVADRGTTAAPSSDYDRLVTAPNTSILPSLFPAEQNSNCSTVVSGLNYDWVSMAAQVDGLNAAGATNQPIGLVWGVAIACRRRPADDANQGSGVHL